MPHYEFSRKHRPRRPPRSIDENADNGVIPQFNQQHYRQEVFKVIDRLVSDINDNYKYVSDIVVPVTVLPSNISKCTTNQVEQLCAAFPNDLEDPDALLAEMQVIGGFIEKSGAKNLREAARLLKDKLLFYPNLAKAYQLALTIPI